MNENVMYKCGRRQHNTTWRAEDWRHVV